MTGKRKILFAGLTALMLVTMFSCSLIPGNLKEGVIALNVGTSGQFRALEVKDYDVESLDLEIFAPDPENPGQEVLVWSEHWVAPASQRYVVQGIGAGTYRIAVTHNGVNGDETYSATEDETFSVAAMKITTINIIPGLLGVLDVEGDDTDPINLTGHWTASWDMGGDFPFEPLYTYLNQQGNIVTMAHGFSGTISGSSITIEGDLGEMGYFSGTSDIISENEVSGPFTIVDNNPETDDIVGTSTMVRTDPSYFGHLDMLGAATAPDGSPVAINLNKEEAMAHTGIDSENDGSGGFWEWEYLEIRFTTDVYDIYLQASISTSDGSFAPVSVYTFQHPGPSDPVDLLAQYIDFSVRYLENGEGIDESNSMEPLLFSGTLYIEEWVQDDHVAGRIVAVGDNNLTANFNIPFSPPDAF